jgi:hypothetical protein
MRRKEKGKGGGREKKNAAQQAQIESGPDEAFVGCQKYPENT